MKFSVCVEMVYGGKDFIESLEAIKKLGYEAFEFWGWWNKDLGSICAAKDRLGLQVAAVCTRFISLVDPSKRAEYMHGLEESIEAAKKLGCSKLISQVGNELQGVSREEQHKSLVNGLKACVPMLEAARMTLVVEPLNIHVDHKGYYLYSSEEGFAIVEEVGSPNVKLLYDIYHQQIMEGHLISRITNNIEKIGHFHSAGNPGRHELHTGEIAYGNVFKAIRDAGYGGYVGLEYSPLEEPEHGLERIMREYGTK